MRRLADIVLAVLIPLEWVVIFVVIVAGLLYVIGHSVPNGWFIGF